MSFQSRTVLLLAVLILLLCVCPVQAQFGSGPEFNNPYALTIEQDGHLVVTDITANGFGGKVVRIDPMTGNRTIVSDESTGTGPNMSFLSALAVEDDGMLIALARNGVFRIDPVSGDREVVSDENIGSGPLFNTVNTLAVEPDGQFIVVDVESNGKGARLLRIDPASGDRTVISSDSVGTGPMLYSPFDIKVEADGQLVVVDINLKAIVRIDPVNGDREVVSDNNMGHGYVFPNPLGIAIEENGNYFVTDNGQNAVLRVNSETGVPETISSNTTGTGPQLALAGGIVVGADGFLVVTDSELKALVRIDPQTGARSILSAEGIGTGTETDVEIPFTLHLSAIYPNPFSHTMTIHYVMAVSQHVSIEVFAVTGARVAVLADGIKPVGTHQVDWHAASLPVGTYFVRAVAGGQLQSKQVVRLP